MKTLYIIISIFILSTGSLSAQLEGMLGDILQEVQDKVGNAQQTSEKASDSEAMKQFKKEIKYYISGINDLDGYSGELKCLYLIIKLATLIETLGANAENAALCQEQYDLYGIQVMALASTSGIVYCYDDLTEFLPTFSNTESSGHKKWEKFANEYADIYTKYDHCDYRNFYYGEDISDCMKINPGLELDFVTTISNALGVYDSFYPGKKQKSKYVNYIKLLLSHLIRVYNPVEALARTIKIGQKMKALPCSDGRTYN